MIFPTLSATTLSCVARERIGYAASLYNMMRNTGAAIGIAYMTTMLVDHEQIHQSRLVEHFSIFDAWKLSEQRAAAAGRAALSLPAANDQRAEAGLRDGLRRDPGAGRDAVFQRHLPDPGGC